MGSSSLGNGRERLAPSLQVGTLPEPQTPLVSTCLLYPANFMLPQQRLSKVSASNMSTARLTVSVPADL